MRRLINEDALIVLYYGFVQSHLTCGLLAWGSANKTNKQSLPVAYCKTKLFGLCAEFVEMSVDLIITYTLH